MLLLRWRCRFQVQQIRYEVFPTAQTCMAAWDQRQRIPGTQSNTSQPVSSAGCACPLGMPAAWSTYRAMSGQEARAKANACQTQVVVERTPARRLGYASRTSNAYITCLSSRDGVSAPVVWVGEGEAVAALWLQTRVRMPRNCWAQAELESSWLPCSSSGFFTFGLVLLPIVFLFFSCPIFGSLGVFARLHQAQNLLYPGKPGSPAAAKAPTRQHRDSGYPDHSTGGLHDHAMPRSANAVACRQSLRPALLQQQQGSCRKVVCAHHAGL